MKIAECNRLRFEIVKDNSDVGYYLYVYFLADIENELSASLNSKNLPSSHTPIPWSLTALSDCCHLMESTPYAFPMPVSSLY